MNEKKDSLKVIKSSIWTVAILLGGSLLILFMMDKYLASIEKGNEMLYMGQVLPFLSGLKAFGYLIVEGLGFILIILLVAYFILRKKAKSNIPENLQENIPT